MPFLRKHPKSGVWQYRFTETQIIDGQKVRRKRQLSLETKNLEDAEKLFKLIETDRVVHGISPAKWIKSHRKGDLKPVNLMGPFVDSFIAHIKTREDLSAKTIPAYIGYAKQLKKLFGDGMAIQGITPQIIRTKLIPYLQRKEDGRTAQTVKNYLRNFHLIFEHAILCGTISHNPFAGINKSIRTKRMKPVFMQPNEMQIFEDFVKGYHVEWARNFFLMLFYSGQRPEETGLLCGDQVYLNVSNPFIRYLGKSIAQKDAPIIDPYVPFFGDKLLRHLQQMPKFLTRERYLFPMLVRSDGTFKKNTVDSAWKRLRAELQEKTDLKRHLQIKSLRSNHATWQAAYGADIYRIMAIHGWEDIKTAMKYVNMGEVLKANTDNMLSRVSSLVSPATGKNT